MTDKIEINLSPEHETALNKRYALVTGEAGSGKTTLIRLMAERDPSYMNLAATTGIAAINLGGITIHSMLKYFDTASLVRAYNKGYIHQKLLLIAARKRVLGIEEVSMLPAQQLDIIMSAIDDIELQHGVKLGLHLIGDMAQLPPVSTQTSPADFCFKAANWQPFADNIVKLTKVWRQSNVDFLAAINAIRRGDGRLGVQLLKKCGVKFTLYSDPKFEGTTLIPNNKDVDSYNTKRLAESTEKIIRIPITIRGTPMKEWSMVPVEQRFKLNAYVMILRNDSLNFTYVNGDCGFIERIETVKQGLSLGDKVVFYIRLIRTDEIVKIEEVVTYNYQVEQPNETQFTSMFHPQQDEKNGMWIVGSLQSIPLRLAYASTVHKSQGLTLDKVQIDSRPPSYGWSGICYVAVSRARTPENLIIVGSEADFASKVRTDAAVKKYI